jgi:cell division protease FtsH
VPFFSGAASEFVEAIVGVGALTRARPVRRRRRRRRPAIIFIDELDAIGRSRTSGVAGFSGGNDEREQTLTRSLTEMDGFDSSTGVIVIARRRTADVLDTALLRPGASTARRGAAARPQGREAILRVHTRSVPLAPTSTSAAIALDARDGRRRSGEPRSTRRRCSPRGAVTTRCTRPTSPDALERIVLGAERKVMMTRGRRRRTAYHEGGHAIVGMLTRAPTRCARSRSSRAARARRHLRRARRRPLQLHEQELHAQDQGRARRPCAEEVVFGDITTGAESDIQQLTQIARQMVGAGG